MTLFQRSDRDFALTLAELNACNPFTLRRIDLERELLGSAFEEVSREAWSHGADGGGYERPNVQLITSRVEGLLQKAVKRLQSGARCESAEEQIGYGELVAHALYYRHTVGLPLDEPTVAAEKRVSQVWNAFRQEHEALLGLVEAVDEGLSSAAHLFACMYQVRRAFRNIFDHIIGSSPVSTGLRSQVWESIFTHDLRRYRRTYFDRMNEITTLILGPSGTGKGLVAKAIALSQYQRFDLAKATFEASNVRRYLPINLAAMAPTLIESELFGHSRGAFTGAIDDSSGWLEECPEAGAVFLDEIGELDPAIQVKLLRVVQERSFSRLGETKERPFRGKLIAATNRNLGEAMEQGDFRSDLYYRLCADVVRTPSLSEQLASRQEDVEELVDFLVRRMAGDEAAALKCEVLSWIDREMPAAYAWPGNIRELEQCIRNIMLRQSYVPQSASRQSGAAASWQGRLEQGALTVDELLHHYCSDIYAREGTYEKAAKVLGVDRRTVRKYVGDGSA